jgi:hypothetical protein
MRHALCDFSHDAACAFHQRFGASQAKPVEGQTPDRLRWEILVSIQR